VIGALIGVIGAAFGGRRPLVYLVSRMRALTLILTAAVLLPSAALSAPVVVYGPASNADAATAAAKAVFGSNDFTVVGNLVTLAGGSVDAPVVVGGRATDCAGGEGVSVGAVVLQAGNEVVEMNYGDALKRLEAASAALPCGASRATKDELYQLYFLQGFAQFTAGDDQAAVEHFAMAAALDPQRSWDKRYPPTAKESFLQGLQRMFDSARADVRVEVDTAFINGEQVGPGSKPTLVAGRHIVRVGGATMLVDVPDQKDLDEDVIITTARALVAGLLAGDNDYAPWLADLAARKKWGDEVLVVGGSKPLVMRARKFEGGSTQASSGPNPTILGAALLGIGAGTAGAGVSLHMVAFDQAGVQESGLVLVEEEEYGPLVGQNRAGFATAVIGGAIMGVGLATTIGTLTSGKKVAVATPWVLPMPDGGLALGLGGRF